MYTPKRAVAAGLFLLLAQPADAQKFLKKVTNAANSVLNSVGNNTANSPANTTTAPGEMPGSSGPGRPANRGGQGLISTPPDVNANLASSEAAFKTKNYGEARYALQQAMLGVELQIGQSILKTLPDEIAGMPKQPAQDQVASTSWGWAGLTIRREYQQGEKALDVTIANNALWMQTVNMFLTSGMYNQSTGGQQDWKQTRLKNNRAVIEFDPGAGYKLTVPIGQTTMAMLEGVNFSTEQEFMKAAEAIDIDKIKELLNEK